MVPRWGGGRGRAGAVGGLLVRGNTRAGATQAVGVDALSADPFVAENIRLDQLPRDERAAALSPSAVTTTAASGRGVGDLSNFDECGLVTRSEAAQLMRAPASPPGRPTPPPGLPSDTQGA